MAAAPKTNLAAYSTGSYNPGSALKRMVWFIVNTLIFKTSLFPFYSFKRFLLRLFGGSIGKGVIIKPNVNIKYPWFLKMGDYVWIGEGVWIDNLGQVEMGDNVCISQGALLISGNHDYTDQYFTLMIKPIYIEDGVWIGAKSIVTGGSVCNSHAVLAAGSLCSGRLEAYTIYRGNPAVAIKKRNIR